MVIVTNRLFIGAMETSLFGLAGAAAVPVAANKILHKSQNLRKMFKG
jgi:hypothetical protein